FEQEARAAGALNHPNLLTIFDTGKQDGRPYIVTELLEGETLRGALRQNGTAIRLPVRKAIDYGIQIANGLAAAHERGIVHRDLKPENLFVTRDGRVKILDFGVAKLRTNDSGESGLSDEQTMEQDTSPGTVIGTVGYMSPEQVRGQSVDPRSDIFSLGTLLYEMLAGEHPFRGDSPADTMSAILREDPRELTSSNPNVNPGLDRVVRHCMEKSPEQRFQSARDLAFHLDMLSSASGTAHTIETSFLESWNRPLVGILGVLALLAAGLLTGWLLRGRTAAAPPQMRFSQVTYEEGLEMQPALSAEGESFVFTRGGGAGSDIYLQRVGGRNAINLTPRCAQADAQPAFSRDGSLIAYRSECEGGGIFVMGATGESTRRLTPSCFNPSWSPDAKRIVCGTESIGFTPTSRGQLSELWTVDASSGERKLLLPSDGVQPNWSPHGQRIAYWGIVGESAQRDIFTIDPSAENPSDTVVRVTDDPAVDWNPVWSPDGQYLYFGSDRNGSMNLWRVRMNEESGKPKGDPEPVTTPARVGAHYSFSRDGSRMLYAAFEQEESLRTVAFDPVLGAVVGQPRPVLAGSFLVFSSQVSPDGRHVAVTNRGVQEDLFVIEIATGEIRQLTNDAARDRGAVWSPDGQKIYFYSQRDENRYEIWRVNADGSNLQRVTRTKGRSVWYPSLSPDGSKLSFYNDEHTFLLDLNQPGAEPQPIPSALQGSASELSSWSPDGTLLAGILRGRPGIVVYSLQDREHRPLTESGARPIWIAPREILYSDGGRLRIVNIDTKAIRDVATPFSIAGMSLSGDARTLVFSDRKVEADVWMAETMIAK
ncbi:MAG TPA: protein kinase, partial [Thermoanaerobaculia bacterium]|nr:protein kinase [Thermoanaerobaculia bacterium]